MELVVLFWLGLSVGVSMLAKHRGRRGWLWFVIAMIISPLAGFALVMLKEDLAVKDFVETISQSIEATHVRCPHCAEYVLPEAVVCKFCRGRLAPQEPALVHRKAQEKIDEGLEEIKGREQTILITCGLALGFAILVWLLF